jgi:hypothetical protein
MKSDPQRLVYFGTIILLIMYASAITLLLLSCGGCAFATRYNNGGGYHLHVYKPFDNAHDWGPNYLVGPPSHYLSNESRIDNVSSSLIEKPASASRVTLSRPLPTLR